MTTPSVVFHANARAQAGGGHVRRCLALAHALRPDCDVTFVLSADRAPSWATVFKEEGIAVRDAAGFDGKAEVAVLDGYDLGPADVAFWRHHAARLVMIEDLGRSFSGIDLYVSPAGPAPTGAPALEGPRYALLPRGYSDPVLQRPAGTADILVTCGLHDSADLTGFYLAALEKPYARARIGSLTVAMGASAPHRRAVEQRAAALCARVLIDVADMRPLYDASDLVLGAGGVSLFERMARGRASVTVTVADNQEHAGRYASRKGGCVLAGRAGAVDADSVAEEINDLLDDAEARARIGRTARELVDGRGAQRAAEAILSLTAKQPTGAVH